jgi:pentapeptide repeat protein
MTRIQQRRSVIAAGLLVGGIVLVLAFALVPRWLEPPVSAKALREVPSAEKRITLQQSQDRLRNSVRSTMLQGLAGLLVIAGAVATWRQVNVTRAGQITDRLTHAIDQIGHDKVDIRVGGIYALERLAKDSAPDRLVVSEILAAFIRAHAPWPAGHHTHPDPHPTPDVDQAMPWLTDRKPDVRTAVLVLGRRTGIEHDQRLPLRRVDLRRTNFYRGTLINVDFRDSNLAACFAGGVQWQSCRLNNVDLRKTRLNGAGLDGSTFDGAHLQGVELRGASLTNVSLRGANLTGADLRDTDLTNADLSGADLSGAKLKGANLRDVRTSKATTWPAGFMP